MTKYRGPDELTPEIVSEMIGRDITDREYHNTLLLNAKVEGLVQGGLAYNEDMAEALMMTVRDGTVFEDDTDEDIFNLGPWFKEVCAKVDADYTNHLRNKVESLSEEHNVDESIVSVFVEQSIEVYSNRMKELVQKVQEQINETIKKKNLIPVKPGMPPSPSPFKFKNEKLAAFASGFPAYGAASAIFSASSKNGWMSDEDGMPRYVKEIKGKNISGRVTYHILLPWDATDDIFTLAHKELAWKILEILGPDTESLHMLLLSYAADPSRRGNRGEQFCIPRQEIYKCLGLDWKKRSDLTTAEKDQKVFEEIKKVRSLGIQIMNMQFVEAKRNKKGNKAGVFNLDKHPVSPLWEIGVREFGQAEVDFEDGEMITRYADWQLVGREGIWGEAFLHDKPMRQFGYMAKDMLTNIRRGKVPFAAALAVKLTFLSRFNPGDMIEVRNKDILEFAGADIYPNDKGNRHSFQQIIINAIDEQTRWGWEIDLSGWPSRLRPGGDADEADDIVNSPDKAKATRMPKNYWDAFLQCTTVFNPANKTTQALLDANKENSIKKIKSKAKVTWLGTDIKDLRKKLKMTQQDLAEYMEVSKSLVGFWENGSRKPQQEHLKKLIQLQKKSS